MEVEAECEPCSEGLAGEEVGGGTAEGTSVVEGEAANAPAKTTPETAAPLNSGPPATSDEVVPID